MTFHICEPFEVKFHFLRKKVTIKEKRLPSATVLQNGYHIQWDLNNSNLFVTIEICFDIWVVRDTEN